MTAAFQKTTERTKPNPAAAASFPSAAIATLRNPFPLEVVSGLIARRVVFWEAPP